MWSQKTKTVYALDASTGALVWNYTTGGMIISSPAVTGGIVYVGSMNGKIYALNATTGAYIWSYTTKRFDVVSSPCPLQAIVVYVGSNDNNVYASERVTTGTIMWNYLTDGPVYSSPAVLTAYVYVGSNDGKVYALDASNGTLRMELHNW